MPARLVEVTIINYSDYPIVWQDDGRIHGFWQDPWFPSNIKNLMKGQTASFRLESGGVMTGVEGWALFKIDIPNATNVPPRTEFFRLNFSRAYFELEHFKGGIDYWLQDPRTGDAPHDPPQQAYVRNVATFDMGLHSSFLEILPAVPIPLLTFGVGIPIEAPFFFINESIPKHVGWIVEVRGMDISSTLPLRVATKNVIYAVKPRTSVATHVRGGGSVSGGDLTWFRHDGRVDGKFAWEGPQKVGNRWDGLKHLFAGDDGIIYAVTPRIEPTASSEAVEAFDSSGNIHSGIKRASGGDLMWYRHLGREDGSFKWMGPRRVGIGWHGFKHIFSGGDGVIYGVQYNGDLLWYRHVGRADGSFLWEGPRKVGTGWGDLTHVFSGGEGILYAITPRVDETIHFTGAKTPASGGDLMWYRHLGREDGTFNWEGPRKVGSRWDSLERVICDESGVIYGVTHYTEASFQSDGVAVANFSAEHIHAQFTPASGGDLMWFKHLGREDGTFHWEAPRKVGSGWSGLEHLFCGGVLPN